MATGLMLAAGCGASKPTDEALFRQVTQERLYAVVPGDGQPAGQLVSPLTMGVVERSGKSVGLLKMFELPATDTMAHVKGAVRMVVQAARASGWVALRATCADDHVNVDGFKHASYGDLRVAINGYRLAASKPWRIDVDAGTDPTHEQPTSLDDDLSCLGL